MAYQYQVDGKTVNLEADHDLVAVRFNEPAPHSMRAATSAGIADFTNRLEVAGEKFTILPVAQTPEPRVARFNAASAALSGTPEVARTAPVFKKGNQLILATDRVLVGTTENAQAFTQYATNQGWRVESLDVPQEYVVHLGPTDDPLRAATDLASVAGVDYAEPDFVTVGKHIPKKMSPVTGSVMPLAVSPDPLRDQQYMLKITRANEAAAIHRGLPSVKIAILDEGVDVRHEDLKAAIVGQFDATDNDLFQEPNSWDGHGTCCAGLAAAVSQNGLGVAGTGAGCSIMAVRIALSNRPGGDWVTDNDKIRRAIDWAWRNGADILSNSWGGGAESSAILRAFQRAVTLGRNGKGSVVLIAAGNDDGPVDFPGNWAGALTVSASNEFDEPKTKTSRDGEDWWGSNFGPQVDVAAPGVHNLTTDITGAGGYDPASNYFPTFNGTSSATPIVAGIVGLMLSANPSLTERQVRDIVKQTADKVGPFQYFNGRNDRMGNGRVNAEKAVTMAMNTAALHPQEVLADNVAG